MILCKRETEIGEIAIGEVDGFITNLFFCTDLLPEQVESGETALVREAFLQLSAYLRGELISFTLPLAPAGTPFMRRVWAHLRTLPYGSTASYRDVAEAVGSPRAVRAVGMASHRNPIPLFIPCHRVIGSHGSLTGYRGGLALKKSLLDLESKGYVTKIEQIR
jgi:methylated-DNA-[protein]-cysteine S-methyltransferase